jgi:hypothetical protein
VRGLVLGDDVVQRHVQGVRHPPNPQDLLRGDGGGGGEGGELGGGVVETRREQLREELQFVLGLGRFFSLASGWCCYRVSALFSSDASENIAERKEVGVCRKQSLQNKTSLIQPTENMHKYILAQL